MPAGHWSDWIDSSEMSVSITDPRWRYVRAADISVTTHIDLHNSKTTEGHDCTTPPCDPHPSPGPMIPPLDEFLGAVQTGAVGGVPYGGIWTDPSADEWQPDGASYPENPVEIKSHQLYERLWDWVPPYPEWNYYWKASDQLCLSKLVVSIVIDPAVLAFPTDPDPEAGTYYESDTGTALGWQDWDAGIFVSDATNMDPSDYEVTYMSGVGVPVRGPGDPYGPVEDFFANDGWPMASDGTHLTTITDLSAGSEGSGHMNSVTLPISGLDIADFTLIFTPSATETLTAETLDAPSCPNTLTESKQEYLSSIRQSIDGSPFLRVQPPRYRLWETPTGIPPLRQRARNDGLTTDTRQEKRQLAASPMLVPTQWWVGQPGGGSTT